MEKHLESSNELIEIGEVFSKLPSDLVITESAVDSLIGKMKQFIESAESIQILQERVQKLQEIFYTSSDMLKSTELYTSITENLDSPLYTDAKYNGILKLWSEFPDTLIKVSSKKFHNFLNEANSLPLSSYSLLNTLDDLIAEYVSNKTGIDSTREVILHSILLDMDNPDLTQSLDSDLSDNERRATRKLAVQLAELPILFDNIDISSRNLQKFRLLLDNVGFQILITRVSSKQATQN